MMEKIAAEKGKILEETPIEQKEAPSEVSKSAKELTAFLRSRIEKGSGVAFGPDMDEAVLAYVKKTAESNPDTLVTLRESLAQLEAQPKVIREKEQAIDESLRDLPDYHSLLETRAQLSEVRAVGSARIKKAERPVAAYERLKRREQAKRGPIGRFVHNVKEKFFGKPQRVQYEEDSLAEVRAEWQERLASVEEGLVNAEGNIKTQEEAQVLKDTLHEEFDEFRQAFSDVVVPIQELTLAASRAAHQHLTGLMAKGSLEDLQQAQSYLTHLRTQDTGLDFTGSFDSEQMQQEIDYLTAAAVNTEMDAKIEKAFSMLDFNPNGRGAYEDLEKAIAPYLSLEKLGSKNAQRTKKFFANVLRAKIDGEEDETKQLLLKRLVAKHGLFENKVVFKRGKNGEGVWQAE